MRLPFLVLVAYGLVRGLAEGLWIYAARSCRKRS